MDPNEALQKDLCLQMGRNLREARRRAKLTQTQLAERIGSAGTYIGIIEHGDANITLATLARLAAAVGMEPGALLLKSVWEREVPEVFGRLIDAGLANIRSLRAIRASDEASLDAVEGVLKAILDSLQVPDRTGAGNDAAKP